MFFRKPEQRKKKHPLLKVSVVALAALGVGGIFKCSKNMIKQTTGKIKSLFQNCAKADGAQSDMPS